MGEVLARVQGVSLRRAGGLGSTVRFSLHGLYDDQVRFMLDGVPLEYAGFPFGIANSPVNLVERVEVYRGVGSFVVDLNTFIRKSEDLILQIGGERTLSYQNVYGARALGLEGQLQWTWPGKYVLLDFTPSWIEQRNTSSKGTYGNLKGDRLPNRPYLFASWTAQLRFARVLWSRDTFEPFYEGRWTYEFYRGWESLGLKTYKQVVDRQIGHDIGFVYSLQTDAVRASFSFEVANITDARMYDFFGVQRPGRGCYLKLTGSL